MTSYNETIRSGNYQKIARVLETLEEPSTGFVQTTAYDDKTSSSTFSRLIIKQNNFLIEAVCRILQNQDNLSTEIELIKQRIGRIEVSVTASAYRASSSTTDLSVPIAEISQQLQKLNLGRTVEPTKPSGKLHVYKNPKTIYDEELAKLKKEREKSQ